MVGACKHRNFKAFVIFNRLVDSGRFMDDVRIECADCHLPFQFLGLPIGLDLSGAAMSVDGQEAHLAIAPVGSVPDPLDEGLLAGFRVKPPCGDH